MSLREYFPFPTLETWTPNRKQRASPKLFKVFYAVKLVTCLALLVGCAMWMADPPVGAPEWVTYMSYVGVVVGVIGLCISGWALYSSVGFREYKPVSKPLGTFKPTERVMSAARRLELEYLKR
jgi:hypothetical protein